MIHTAGLPKSYPQEYKDSRLTEVSNEMKRVSAHHELIEARVMELEDLIDSHLWITSDFLGPALASLQEALAATTTITLRLEQVEYEYEQLPVQEWGSLQEEEVDLTTKKNKIRRRKKEGK